MLIEWDAVETETEHSQRPQALEGEAPAPDADPGERFAWLVGR